MAAEAVPMARLLDPLTLTRRQLLGRTGVGLGAIALASLLRRDALGGESTADRPRSDPLAPKPPHFAPRAKRVIYLHMVGAPSQLDLFEFKPALQKHDGQLVPEELIAGERFAFLKGRPKLLGTRFEFRRHGSSGIELSEVLPHLSTVVDKLALIKTVRTEQFNHAPAQLHFQTGFERFGRPSLGSWVTYGLGSPSADLPGFVVLVTGATAGAGNSLWGNGFLPSVYQGVQFRNRGDPVLFLSNPRGIEPSDRRRILDGIRSLNRAQLADVGDPEIATRIAQYELAYRMQTAVPDLMDTGREPAEIHALYGTEPGKASFANNCLLARRLVEQGVRFVQLYDSGWDHHGAVHANIKSKARQVDRPVAALIKDLAQRGLLDDTLVVWGSEFGRTPMLQGKPGKNPGRDHHKDAFCVWMAGGGVKPGTVYGRTDELGYHSVEDPMTVNDLHATILHLLGIDHEELTFRFQGRDFRLTDVGGDVAEKLLA